MCSYDVTSLLTSIPLAETIDICMDSLYRDPQIKKPRTPEKLLRKMLLKATTEVESNVLTSGYRSESRWGLLWDPFEQTSSLDIVNLQFRKTTGRVCTTGLLMITVRSVRQ